MESEVRTRSTEYLIAIILASTERMWQADHTGVYSTEPLLWEDRKNTAEFGAVNCTPKLWKLFEVPSVDSAFWRLVLRDAWYAAPALPNGEAARAHPWDVVIEPDDNAETVAAKLEQARDLLLQALASGELNQ